MNSARYWTQLKEGFYSVLIINLSQRSVQKISREIIRKSRILESNALSSEKSTRYLNFCLIFMKDTGKASVLRK